MKYDLLEKLSNAPGVSGNEYAVREIIANEIKPYVDDMRTDHLGNLITYKKGTKRGSKKIMLAAHMDEVGLMISHTNDKGLLYFQKVGGMDDRVLPAKNVRIGKDRVPGVICMKPIHLTRPEEREKIIRHDAMMIDIGTNTREETEKIVKQGDYAVFDTAFEQLGRVCKGKAFDDRAGCAVLIELLKSGPYPYDLYPVFTTMEEVGLRGARVAAFTVKPDAAFVLEGTICDDGPKETDTSPTTELGKGPAITMMDSSIIADKKLVQLLLSTAENERIPCQIKQPGKGGTDAGAIHLSGTGIPSVPIAVPCRYIHAPVSIISKQDFVNTIKLLSAVLKKGSL